MESSLSLRKSPRRIQRQDRVSSLSFDDDGSSTTGLPPIDTDLPLHHSFDSFDDQATTARSLKSSLNASQVLSEAYYSADFEPVTTARSTHPISLEYSEDFESEVETTQLVTHNVNNTEEFETESSPRSKVPSHETEYSSETATTARSVKPSLAYSDDFDPLTEQTVQQSVAYSDTFEATTERTNRLSYAYSEDFEQETQNQSVEYSEDFDATSTLKSLSLIKKIPRQLSGTFHSMAVMSVSLDTIDSDAGETLTESSVDASKSRTWQDDSVSVTKTSFSRTSTVADSYTDETETESIEESIDDHLEAEATQSSFLSRKLEMLCSKASKGKPQQKPQPRAREDKDQKSYCKRKVELLLKKKLLPENEQPQKTQEQWAWSRLSKKPVTAFGFSEEMVNRLKMKNLLGNMKKAAETKIHEPKKCKDCRNQHSEMAKKTFVDTLLSVAKANNVETKLNNPYYFHNDPVAMMGEGVLELAGLSDKPADVLRRLLKPLENQPEFNKDSESRPSLRHREDKIRSDPAFAEQVIKEASKLAGVSTKPPKFWKSYFGPLEDCAWFPNHLGGSELSEATETDNQILNTLGEEYSVALAELSRNVRSEILGELYSEDNGSSYSESGRSSRVFQGERVMSLSESDNKDIDSQQTDGSSHAENILMMRDASDLEMDSLSVDYKENTPSFNENSIIISSSSEGQSYRLRSLGSISESSSGASYHGERILQLDFAHLESDSDRSEKEKVMSLDDLMSPGRSFQGEVILDVLDDTTGSYSSFGIGHEGERILSLDDI